MAIAGLLGLDEGFIMAGNRELSRAGKRVPPEQRGIGWVPQEASLFPHLSVRDNIGFGLRKGRRRNERVEELATLVGLTSFLDRSPGQLSGGQAQRVALARALAPPLMCCYWMNLTVLWIAFCGTPCHEMWPEFCGRKKPPPCW